MRAAHVCRAAALLMAMCAAAAVPGRALKMTYFTRTDDGDTPNKGKRCRMIGSEGTITQHTALFHTNKGSVQKDRWPKGKANDADDATMRKGFFEQCALRCCKAGNDAENGCLGFQFDVTYRHGERQMECMFAKGGGSDRLLKVGGYSPDYTNNESVKHPHSQRIVQ